MEYPFTSSGIQNATLDVQKGPGQKPRGIFECVVEQQPFPILQAAFKTYQRQKKFATWHTVRGRGSC